VKVKPQVQVCGQNFGQGNLILLVGTCAAPARSFRPAASPAPLKERVEAGSWQHVHTLEEEKCLY
jgi:hypothetical protein